MPSPSRTTHPLEATANSRTTSGRLAGKFLGITSVAMVLLAGLWQLPAAPTFAVVLTGGVIGIVTGATLGRVVGNRPGAVGGTLVGAAVGVTYAYALNAGTVTPNQTITTALTIAAALLCGLQGGVFYAFSTGVMPALARQPHPSGMDAMATINVVVFNPWFGAAFSLAPVTCAFAVITALGRSTPEAPWIIAGGALFLIGNSAVTALCNVPLNDQLEATAGNGQEFAEFWSRFLREWTFWNHVRAGAA